MKLFGGLIEVRWYGTMRAQVRNMLRDGKTIGAIKFVREKKPYMGLAEAKAYVDDIRRELGQIW